MPGSSQYVLQNSIQIPFIFFLFILLNVPLLPTPFKEVIREKEYKKSQLNFVGQFSVSNAKALRLRKESKLN